MISLKKNVLGSMIVLMGASFLPLSEGRANPTQFDWKNAGVEFGKDVTVFTLSEAMNGTTPLPGLNKAASYASLGSLFRYGLRAIGYGDSFIALHGERILNACEARFFVEGISQLVGKKGSVTLSDLVIRSAWEGAFYGVKQLMSWGVSKAPVEKVVSKKVAENPWAQFAGRFALYEASNLFVTKGKPEVRKILGELLKKKKGN